MEGDNIKHGAGKMQVVAYFMDESHHPQNFKPVHAIFVTMISSSDLRFFPINALPANLIGTVRLVRPPLSLANTATPKNTHRLAQRCSAAGAEPLSGARACATRSRQRPTPSCPARTLLRLESAALLCRQRAPSAPPRYRASRAAPPARRTQFNLSAP